MDQVVVMYDLRTRQDNVLVGFEFFHGYVSTHKSGFKKMKDLETMTINSLGFE